MKSPFAKSCVAVTLVASFSFGTETRGQTVQLPTFHQFGIVTTIIVPTRGVTYPAGNVRSRLGASRLAPGAERGFGGTHMAGGVSVGATIIDNNELDRAVLAEAARRRGAAFDILGRPIDGGQAATTDYPPPKLTPRPPTAVPSQTSGGGDKPLILVRPISGSRR